MDVDVRHIAKLAKLHLAEDEVPRLAQEMAAIMGMVENLPEMENAAALLDTGNIMALREDAAVPSYPREAILANAPQAAEGCFAVPKTVD